jgi:hypothetical protein
MATDITLNPSLGLSGQTNISKVFTLMVPSASADGTTRSTLRLNLAAALGAPEQLLISHQAVRAKSGVPAVDRHLIRTDITKPADSTNPEVTLSCYLNMVVPRGLFTSTEIKDSVGILIDLINSGTVLTRLLQNDNIVEV